MDWSQCYSGTEDEWAGYSGTGDEWAGYSGTERLNWLMRETLDSSLYALEMVKQKRWRADWRVSTSSVTSCFMRVPCSALTCALRSTIVPFLCSALCPYRGVYSCFYLLFTCWIAFFLFPVVRLLFIYLELRNRLNNLSLTSSVCNSVNGSLVLLHQRGNCICNTGIM